MSMAQEPLLNIETLQRQLTAARGRLARERQHLQETQEAFEELLEAYNGLGEDHGELHSAFERLAALHEGLLSAYDQLRVEHQDLQRVHQRVWTLFVNSLRNPVPPATTDTRITALATSLAAPVSTSTAAAASIVAAAMSTSGAAAANTSLNTIVTDSAGALTLVQPLWTGLVGDVPDSHAVHLTTTGVVACKRCGSQVKPGKHKKKSRSGL
ncbi:hypothetical protein C8R45DRAFT_1089061 [Mycena sanguinolenta]|nr:hypothetical protein C8R45DRAFT_1089061 [Mycena sanguinolenta]